ncbi:MAG: hypothetical protein IJH55_01695 [Romboutsia sp.]|nr:hypothetical protein [Romboutsia sp.]
MLITKSLILSGLFLSTSILAKKLTALAPVVCGTLLLCKTVQIPFTNPYPRAKHKIIVSVATLSLIILGHLVLSSKGYSYLLVLSS